MRAERNDPPPGGDVWLVSEDAVGVPPHQAQQALQVTESAPDFATHFSGLSAARR
jgi:hypothetical protein